MNQTLRDFVDSWGELGANWGINSSVARVHGLLLASDQAFSLDEIASTLKIAKSNASTSLKELRAWGVVRKVSVPGERKERFTSEKDAWTMLFNIARHRKQREFDPALRALRSALAAAERNASSLALLRLRSLESMFSTMEAIAGKALANEGTARTLLGFLSGK